MARELQRIVIFAARVLLLAFVCLFMCLADVNAQDAQPQATPLPAPPPFKMIVKEERAAIEETNDSTKRLKLTIEYASGHLTRAEQHTARENYEAASAEI